MKKIFKVTSIILVFLFVSGYLILFFLPKPPLLEGLSFSKVVYDRHHHLLRMTLSQDDKYRVFTPLSQYSKDLVASTLLQEDYYFFWHYGLNPLALSKALWQTYVLHSRRLGASTITMQLARMRYGIHSKNISGKLWQMIRAIQLEMHYSKNQILEAYLNLAPYGGNIEGAGAASLIYFNHSANTLSLPQALTLSVIPQNPSKRSSGNKDLKKIRNHLWARWLVLHPEDADKKMLFDLPLMMCSLHHLPFYAPHMVNEVLLEAPSKLQDINTSLDYKRQRVFEQVVQHYIARKKQLGVYNAAVLLVDTRDMGVRALIGSSDFFNKKISGEINGVEMRRSPGSALKPFIYGLALDQGLIHPNTVLKDVPHSFKGYNPENFDYDFMGPIKAKDALVLSRNIPAIDLASQLSNPSLHQLLEAAQVSHLKPESYYGLSLSLGGIELSMHELVGLYAMLVNQGLWYPLQFTQNAKHHQGVRLLSPEASFLVLDMLKDTPRADAVLQAGKENPVSWKTGTSSGFRDAWTLGSVGPYVLGVWIGNFDNKANPAFVGKDIAAPLFFELIEAMKQEDTSWSLEQFPTNLHLEQVKVCKASGLLKTRYCTDTEWTWFIPGKSPIKTDTIFREVAINSKTGLRTCHINKDTRFEVFEFWPSDLLKIFKKAGIQRHTPPFFEPDCSLSENRGLSPQISSPQAGIQYMIQANNRLNDKIPFSAVTDAGVAHLYWFVNETFIAKTKPDHPFFWTAQPGSFVVRVVDDRGLSDARDLTVQIVASTY